MNILKNLVVVLAIALGFGLVMPVSVYAANVINAQCLDVPDSAVCQQSSSSNDLAKNIINTLLYLVGALSVIMIIVGGIMYATSAGDAGQVTKAKQTLTYAVVGLVVSFAAFAIVKYAVSLFAP